MTIKQARAGNDLTFDLPMPPSVNSMFKNVPGKGRAKTKSYKNWITEAGWMLIQQRNQRGRHACIKSDVEVIVRAYRGGSMARDLDNILKAILDLLTSTQTIEDDRQVIGIDARWVDEGVPCTVTVKEVPALQARGRAA